MPFSLRLVMHKDFLVIHWRGKSFFNFGRKVILLTIFFGHSATSEVKGQFYKVMDNSAKYMYKTFRKSIITGSWIRTFLCYDLILNDFMDKNFCKGQIFWQFFFGCLVTSGQKLTFKGRTYNYYFRVFNDLRGQRRSLESCGQFSEVHVQEFL